MVHVSINKYNIQVWKLSGLFWVWKFSGLLRCEQVQACLCVKNIRPDLGVQISGLKFSGVKFFDPQNLAQFQPNLHV